MKNLEKLKEKIQMLYQNHTLTDDELDLIVYNLVQFYTIGAKIAYQYTKQNKNTGNGSK